MRDLVGPPPCATRVRDYGAPQVSLAYPRGRRHSSSRLAGGWRRLASPVMAMARARFDPLSRFTALCVVPLRALLLVVPRSRARFRLLRYRWLSRAPKRNRRRDATRTILRRGSFARSLAHRAPSPRGASFLSRRVIVALLIFFSPSIRAHRVRIHIVVIMIRSRIHERATITRQEKQCRRRITEMFSVLSMIEMVYFVGTLGIFSRCRLAVFKLDFKTSG